MSQAHDIEDYIRKSRELYTREAITNNLLAMGHRQEDIDRIWAIVEPVSSDNQEPAVHPKVSFAGIIPLWLAGLGCGLIYTYFFAGLKFETFYLSDSEVPRYLAVNGLLIAVEVGALVGANMIRKRGGSMRNINGLLIAINFVLFFVVLGICLSGGFRA